jgi:hypothetical protein
MENILVITHNYNASFLQDVILNIDVDFNNDTHLRNFNNAQIKHFKY